MERVGGCRAVITHVQGEEDSEWACLFDLASPGPGFTRISLRDLCLRLAHQMCLKCSPSGHFQALSPSW